MPVCTLHLLQLASSITLSAFLSQLRSNLPSASKPLIVSRVVRWIIRPSVISVPQLLDHPWDILIILAGSTGIPPLLLTSKYVIAQYTLHTGIPSSLLKTFPQVNQGLLYPTSAPPSLTGSLETPRIASSAQKLELSPELRGWIPTWEGNDNARAGSGAVSMLNLLTFKPGMHSEYLKYGKAFGERIGKRRGGTAKLVGKIVPPIAGGKSATAGNETGAKVDEEGSRHWDEMALAHYPNMKHFEDMIASEDYQEVNLRSRVPSLLDTCILMTSELDLPDGRTTKL